MPVAVHSVDGFNAANMELIPYPELARLSMNRLVPGSEPSVLDGVEWAAGYWIEQSYHGGTSLYHPEDRNLFSQPLRR